VNTPDNSVYAGVHSRGLEGPWKHADGYLVWVVDENVVEEEGAEVRRVKWIKEFPSQFMMGLHLGTFFRGQYRSGREYLGPLGMQWYPRNKVPWQVVETFIGCRTNEALASPEVRLTCLTTKSTYFSYLCSPRSG
jgi:hypothetical protein